MTHTADSFGRFSGRMPDTIRLASIAAMATLAVEPIFGGMAAMGFLAFGMLLLALRPADGIMDLVGFWWLLAIPILCIVSVLWSDAPGTSLRAGIQLLLTFIFAILVARRLPPAQFLIALVFVMTAIAGLSIVAGSYRSDTGALTGFFASKNAMGGAAVLLAVAAAGIAHRAGASWTMWLAALGATAVGLVAAVLAQSMGALVALSVGLGVYGILRLVRPLTLRLQAVVALGSILLVALALTLLIANLEAVALIILDATGKDITLTGRTDLWAVALENIADRPWLGHGYQAFWRIGNPEAEDLWRAFGIESRSGFHFHNLYLSNAVELGVIGAAIQTVLLFWLGFAALRLALLSADYRAATFMAVTMMALSLTPLEVPVFFPFNLLTFIVVATAVYVSDGLAATRVARNARA